MSAFAGYMDCVQYCYNGRCVTAENKFVCLCNTGYTGNKCTKRSKLFRQAINKIKQKMPFDIF